MDNSKEGMKFTNYLFALTDDVGIFQHSRFGIPDRNYGYTTDDNVRALILAVMLFEKHPETKYLDLVYTYLAFVNHALNKKGGFMNFMNYQREFLEANGSEDCFGRCIWALGRTLSSPAVPENMKNTCRWILDEVDETIEKISSPRAKAYIIVGLSFLKDLPAKLKHVEVLSTSLVEQYEKYNKDDWHWFENSITYGNSFLPWSLFCAYKVLKDKRYLKTAIESMEFLESIVMKKGYFKPLGCNGWLEKGGKPSEFDEQPLEACEMLHTYLEYYEISKDKKQLENAMKCYKWYEGVNFKKLCLIDKETGACYDGIHSEGLNYNQGSESTISLGMAFMRLSESGLIV